MHNIKYKNWSEFKSNFMGDLTSRFPKSSPKDFLFRGQADSGWKLESSFDRIEKDKSKYNSLLIEFKDILSKYNFNDELLSSNDDNIIAAYGQHYGLRTRLLDWTTSPYFAAFFAVSTHFAIRCRSSACTIWAINRDSESLRQYPSIDFVKLISNKFNYRMKNQLGHFTLSRHSEDSVDEFDNTIVIKTGIDDLLLKCDLDCTDAIEILDDLEIMGITHSIAFPDIVGYIEEALFKTRVGH